MSLINVVVGATSDSGAIVVAKVETGPVRVAVSTSASMTAPVFHGPESVDGEGVAKVAITGLASSTRYWYQVEDNSVLDTSVTGQLITHPAAGSQASFTFAVSACAGSDPEFPGADGGELRGDRISNHPVFDTIRTRALENDWLFFAHLGDLTYYNLGQATFPDSTVANYRRQYDDVLLQPRQHQLYREVPWVHLWDDHDYGPNDSDGTHPDKANAAQVYREREPHYPLSDPDGIWRTFTIGRVLFVGSDVRYYRSPNGDPDDASKTMLGSAQKTWMDGLLASSDAEVLVWLMPDQWLGVANDSWTSFQTERDELAAMLADRGWADRMVMVYGDRHGVGIDSGGSNPWGGFPIMQAASLDSAFGIDNPDLFDVLPDMQGRNQYGTVQVTDLGAVITVRMTAWQGTSEVGSLQVGFTTSTPPPSFAGSITDVISGSHRATVEARVLTTFQTGDDPDGTEIEIIDGQVHYDATAKVFATLELETSGMDESRRSRFPRKASDLLAPYGHEVFVRRGVDTGGGGIVWVPLGYFRLDDDEQAPASDGPIRLSGQDRMAGIIDGELVVPRQYQPGQSVAEVVMDLVEDIYPAATIVFDDESGSGDIGRQVLVERDRYGALHDIANSLGKIMYWDGQGILRIEDAPDPDDLVWDIKAGHHGVLVDVNRRVGREGMVNGIVARGEGGDVTTPVTAIAVDAGPNSPTRWFPPSDPSELWFGQVPGRYTSPLLTTASGAFSAASKQLRRRIGMPYSVDFGAVTNPTLRPREAVRVTHKDGTRERHLVDTVTIPLRTGAAMSGTTREQTQVRIGSVVPAALQGG